MFVDSAANEAVKLILHHSDRITVPVGEPDNIAAQSSGPRLAEVVGQVVVPTHPLHEVLEGFAPDVILFYRRW